MSLELNIADFEPRPPKTPLVFQVERELTEADLALVESVPAGEAPPDLKKITDRHHMLARLLASGMSEEEAAIHTGYSLSRVSILKNSRAFIEVQNLYREQANEEFFSVFDHMAGLSRDALLQLRERIEESPDRISTTDLLKIVDSMTEKAIDNPRDKVLPTVIELVAPENGSSSLSDEGGQGEGEAD